MPAQPQQAVVLAGLALAGLSWVCFLLAAAAITAIARRSSATSRGPRTPASAPAGDSSPRAGALLVELDDALEAAERDAGLAEAEFGEEVARPFRDALDEARASSAEAFRLQRVGDPAALADALVRCERARSQLAAQSARFEELRAHAHRAPEVAREVERAVTASSARVAGAEATLVRLRAMYAASALAAVADAPERARERLQHASGCADEARALMRAGDASGAAAHLGRAQEAVAEAQRLLDAVDETAERLEAQRERLTVGLAEMHPADGRFQQG